MTLQGNGNGNGYGKGTGKGGRGSGGNHDARIAEYVAAYMPDAPLHAEKAVRQAIEHAGARSDDQIHEHIRRWFPHLVPGSEIPPGEMAA